jgi:ABC-type sugar transport system ATPase subunit
MSPAPLLELRRIAKRFGATEAVKPLDLTVHAGEIHAVVGENGAGKSTLMKLVAGVLRPSSGEILLDGRICRFHSRHDARRAGVALLPQEVEVPENLSAAQALSLGREQGFFIRTRSERERALAALQRVAAQFAPTASVESLSVAERQLLLLARALDEDARLLVLDEPTSALSLAEADHLMSLLRVLRERGTAVLLISHKLREVELLADRVSVLRDGALVAAFPRGGFDGRTLVRAMVGRQLDAAVARESGAQDVLLQVNELVTRAWPRHAISCHVKRGEIVGLAGLVGAGKSEILRALFGADDRRGGCVSLAGSVLPSASPSASVAAHVGYLPEDRRSEAAFDDHSVEWNLSAATVSPKRGAFWRQLRTEKHNAMTAFAATGVRGANLGSPMQALSGGNQQKVVLGRWLPAQPQLLLLDEPTRGIDVAARADIHALLRQLADTGTSILFASSDMEELLALADRVLVLHEGRLSGELHHAELSEERIMALATGHAA